MSLSRILWCGGLLVWCAAPVGAQTWKIAPDDAIRERLRRFVEEQRHAPGAVVGVLEVGAAPENRVRFFSHGESGRREVALNADTLFELGSITKAFTGLLLAEMATRGEVRLDATLGALPPRAAPPLPAELAGLTLEQLATHRSGLPRVPLHPWDLAPLMLRRDPYAGSTPAGLLAAAARSPARGSGGRFAYSNLGYAVLGQALAAAGGLPYEEFLRQRVLEPYGFGNAVLSPEKAPADRLARGFQANGWPAPHWHLDAYAPAGGAIASARELLRFFERAIESPTPAWQLATAPRHPTDDSGRRHVGLGWMLRRGDNGTLVWHNGGTGGFRTFAAVVPEQRIALVVLTNGGGNADALALSLIEAGRAEAAPRPTPWLGLLLVFFGVVLAPATVWRARQAGRLPAPPSRAADRLDALAALAGAAFLLAISTRAGAWQIIPPFTWWLGLAATAAAAVGLLRDLPRRAWLTRGKGSRAVRLVLLSGFAALAVALAG